MVPTAAHPNASMPLDAASRLPVIANELVPT
jgi:hypothetical protein